MQTPFCAIMRSWTLLATFGGSYAPVHMQLRIQNSLHLPDNLQVCVHLQSLCKMRYSSSTYATSGDAVYRQQRIVYAYMYICIYIYIYIYIYVNV